MLNCNIYFADNYNQIINTFLSQIKKLRSKITPEFLVVVWYESNLRNEAIALFLFSSFLMTHS